MCWPRATSSVWTWAGRNPGQHQLNGWRGLHQDGGALRERCVGRRCRALSLLDVSPPRCPGLVRGMGRVIPYSEERCVWAQDAAPETHGERQASNTPMCFLCRCQGPSRTRSGFSNEPRSWSQRIPVVIESRCLEALSEHSSIASGGQCQPQGPQCEGASVNAAQGQPGNIPA